MARKRSRFQSRYQGTTARAFAEAHDAFVVRDIEEDLPEMTAELVPAIEVEPHDPRRMQAFKVSLGLTALVVVAGWAYFFTGQVRDVADEIPALAQSEFVDELSEEVKGVSTETVSDVVREAEAGLVDPFQEVQNAAATVVALQDVLGEMEERIEGGSEPTESIESEDVVE